MKNVVKVDMAIIGGGISGLWLLNRLRKLGYSAILLEGDTLGGGQTNKAQGIIHGGIKFALQGLITSAAQSIIEMPAVWQKCLAGTGEINLSNVPVLSSQQYLWSPNTLSGKLSGFFANLAFKNRVTMLDRENFPDIFQHPDFNGQVYVLNEIVVDVNSLIRELARQHQDAIFKIPPLTAENLHFDAAGNLEKIQIGEAPLGPIAIQAQKFIFAAGAGNELLNQVLPSKEFTAQRRPLHMPTGECFFN